MTTGKTSRATTAFGISAVERHGALILEQPPAGGEVPAVPQRRHPSRRVPRSISSSSVGSHDSAACAVTAGTVPRVLSLLAFDCYGFARQ